LARIAETTNWREATRRETDSDAIERSTGARDTRYEIRDTCLSGRRTTQKKKKKNKKKKKEGRRRDGGGGGGGGGSGAINDRTAIEAP